MNFVSNTDKESTEMKYASPKISAVMFPGEHWPIAKAYWQHTGDGVSSRRAEYCHELLKAGILVEKKDDAQRFCKGPRRYRKSVSNDNTPIAIDNAGESQDGQQFIEERFGRNLELKFTEMAKLAIRKRIAGKLTADVPLEDALELEHDQARTRKIVSFSEDDIYLYSCGMNAIFDTQQKLMAARGLLKGVVFG